MSRHPGPVPSAAKRFAAGPIPMSGPAVLKECACGRRHTAAAWAALQFVGVAVVPDEPGDPGWTIEMRNCDNCNSTIAIEVP